MPPPPKVPTPVAELPEITQSVTDIVLLIEPEIMPPPPTGSLFSASDGYTGNREIEVRQQIRVHFDNAIIWLSLLNDRRRCSSARDDRIVGPDVEIPDRVIAGKTFHSAAGNIQLVGSGRHVDRGARVQVGERDRASQATVIRRSGTGRSGNIVSSIYIDWSKRQWEACRCGGVGGSRCGGTRMR